MKILKRRWNRSLDIITVSQVTEMWSYTWTSMKWTAWDERANQSALIYEKAVTVAR